MSIWSEVMEQHYGPSTWGWPVLDDPQTLKKQARWAVQYALRTGALQREACEIRGCTATAQAHHHHGYDPEHWLCVRWLCQRHHQPTEPGAGIEPAAARLRIGCSTAELPRRRQQRHRNALMNRPRNLRSDNASGADVNRRPPGIQSVPTSPKPDQSLRAAVGYRPDFPEPCPKQASNTVTEAQSDV